MKPLCKLYLKQSPLWPLRFTALWLALVMSSTAFGIENIEEIRFKEAKIGFQGSAAATVSNATGNTNRDDWGVDVLSRWKTNTNEFLFLVGRNYGQDPNSTYTDNSFMHFRWNYLPDEFLSYEAFVQKGTDKIRDLEDRSLLGAGIRLKLHYQPKYISHHLGIGAFDETETYQKLEDPKKQNQTRGNLYWSLYWSPELAGAPVTIGNILYYQPSFKSSADQRQIHTLTLKYHLSRAVGLKLSNSSKTDTAPPPGLKKNDRTTKLKLTYRF